MAITDFSQFVIAPDDYSGLTRAIQMEDQRKWRSEQMGREQRARKSTATNFLEDYSNPKQYLTGTAADPVIVATLTEARNKGVELVEQGADTSQIMAALSPYMNKVGQYSATAKEMDRRVNDYVDTQIKQGNKAGYNWAAIKEMAKKRAFFKPGPDGKPMLDIDNVDLDENSVVSVIRDNPELVTDSSGIDEFVKENKGSMVQKREDVTQYNPTAGFSRRKVDMKYPAWMVPDYEQQKDSDGNVINVHTGYAPKYDLAFDADEKAIIGEFEDRKKAQVRLLDEELYDSISRAKPAIADYVRGQVRIELAKHEQETGEKIPENSPKAKIVARSIMYDELKNRGTGMYGETEVLDKPGTTEAAIAAKEANLDSLIKTTGALAGAAASSRAQVKEQYAETPEEREARIIADEKAKIRAKEEAEREEREKIKDRGVESFRTGNGKVSAVNSKFKGKSVADGEVVKVDTPYFGKGYYVNVKGADGKIKEKKFSTKEELLNYLEGGASATSTAPSGKSLTPEQQKRAAELRKRYIKN